MLYAYRHDLPTRQVVPEIYNVSLTHVIVKWCVVDEDRKDKDVTYYWDDSSDMVGRDTLDNTLHPYLHRSSQIPIHPVTASQKFQMPSCRM